MISTNGGVLASLQAEGSVIAVPSREMVPLCSCDNDVLIGDQFAKFFRVEKSGGVMIAGSGSHSRIKVCDSESGAIRLSSGVSGRASMSAIVFLIPWDLI